MPIPKQWAPASVQEARSDLFSLFCPLRPVLKGPSHCLNHFHDSVTSILRLGGRDSQPAQTRRPSSMGSGPGSGWGAWEKEGDRWMCLSPPCPLHWILAPISFPGPSTHCPCFLLLREAESSGRECRVGAALLGAAR